MKRIGSRPLSRRALIAWAGWGAALGAAGRLGWGQGGSEPADAFLARVTRLVEGGRSPLQGALLSLPELQAQPRPLSSASVAGRERFAALLDVDLAQTPASQLLKATPLIARYPAWLAVAVSLELFELQLETGPLPAFELPGVAREHVLPYTALIDQALIPACTLLRTPDRPFDPATGAGMAEHVLQLKGRLILLGEEALISTAETLHALLAQGEDPVLLRAQVGAEVGEDPPALHARFAHHPRFNAVDWRFNAAEGAWETATQGRRAIDRLLASLLVGRLFARCAPRS